MTFFFTFSLIFLAFERLRLRIMSRLTEPNFEEIYLLVRDIAARAGEGDAALEETLEAMAVKFRVIQVRLDDAVDIIV